MHVEKAEKGQDKIYVDIGHGDLVDGVSEFFIMEI